VKPGDLVWIEGYNVPAVFVSWCTDEDSMAEYGMANLLVNGSVHREHTDWWQPWNPDLKKSHNLEHS